MKVGGHRSAKCLGGRDNSIRLGAMETLEECLMGFSDVIKPALLGCWLRLGGTKG